MASTAVRIKLEGEDWVEVTPRLSGLIAAERNGKSLESIEGAVFASWFQLGMPGGADGFDDWVNRIEDFEQANGNGTDPTTAAPSGESLPSLPPPA